MCGMPDTRTGRRTSARAFSTIVRDPHACHLDHLRPQQVTLWGKMIRAPCPRTHHLLNLVLNLVGQTWLNLGTYIHAYMLLNFSTCLLVVCAWVTDTKINISICIGFSGRPHEHIFLLCACASRGGYNYIQYESAKFSPAAHTTLNLPSRRGHAVPVVWHRHRNSSHTHMHLLYPQCNLL
jgi:hypothetical protein